MMHCVMTTINETADPTVPATPEKPESFVDEVFDLLTARASKALVVVAKWLEERAKAASTLATKLDHSTR
jgi:hypothetical protein